ncbi:ATP-binding cassette domain-containing protein [Natrialba sp. PRR66]|uniref:ATP-binding cassette domain-containing protein n=1 Tax=Natrialba sp. PRR66 TaxID=3098146 RepID=UPI002B1DEC5F|nr:ATP-binding cassette domain-containing protein [Natrialba sp. PRR66]
MTESPTPSDADAGERARENAVESATGTETESATTAETETATTALEPASIAVDGLSLSFGEVPVLENVSLSVEPGEFVGVVGPNGAGKTTLLRAISGALEPDAGTVAVDEVAVHGVSSRASSRLVAVVPQDTALSFAFPVRDVVEMGRHPHRSRFSSPTPADRAAVERALERTRTAKLADRPIDEISGGQRQRVVLARAIAQETPALLLDEPTASLDVNHQIETLELVRELVDSGRTAVAAIHDLDLAARYCDRLALLADGAVHDVGTPSSVLTTDALAEAFDATATVTTNPITGTETVTALPDATVRDSIATDVEDGSHDNEDTDGSRSNPARVHLIGTGTAAAGVLSRLAAAELDLSIGPVTPGDAAEEAARRLTDESSSAGVETIRVDPFAPVSADARDELAARIDAADATVLADPALGGETGRVLELVASVERPVVVDTQRFADRSGASTGGEGTTDEAGAGEAARTRYEACRKRGVEVPPENVLEGVATALSESERTERPRDAGRPADATMPDDGTAPANADDAADGPTPPHESSDD